MSAAPLGPSTFPGHRGLRSIVRAVWVRRAEFGDEHRQTDGDPAGRVRIGSRVKVMQIQSSVLARGRGSRPEPSWSGGLVRTTWCGTPQTARNVPGGSGSTFLRSTRMVMDLMRRPKCWSAIC